MDMDPPRSIHFPYEILREIISLAQMYIPKPEETDEPELDLQLVSPPIAASHVCRSWRYDLLSDPFMWTCLLIPQTKPMGILEILRRSGSTSLNVFLIIKRPYEPGNYDHIGMLKTLFQQIHRFRLLHLQVTVSSYYGSQSLAIDYLKVLTQKVLAYLRHPAPNLQTFRFWYKNTSLPLNQTYLKALFSGEAPHLKQIHYQPSFDFRERSCSLFHDLSELYLTLPNGTIELSRLLHFIELSPRLKLLRVYSHGGGAAMIAYQVPSSFRKVNLPCLERLILEVNHIFELIDLILECVTFPDHVNWHIATQYRRYEVKDSPHLPRLLSRTHFASFHILFNHYRGVDLILKEKEHGPQYLNQFVRNKLVFMFNDVNELVLLWDTANPYVEASSRITHLELVFENVVEPSIIQKFLQTMRSLRSLTIRQKTVEPYDPDEPCLSCLAALLPSKSNANAENTALNPSHEPVLNPLSALSLEDHPVPPTSTSATFPCALLNELTVELSDSLNKRHASMFRLCSDRRREEGCSLRVLVRCPDIEAGVESILQTGGGNNIRVMIDSSLC